MEKKSRDPLQWLNLMVSEPFYFYHFLAFFSYIVVRISATQILSSDFSNRLLHREIQAILALSMLIVIKLIKEETWEGFVADSLFFAKGFLIVVTLIMDYHLALCYSIGLLVIFVITQQPPYHGLGTSSKLTPLQLEVLLTEGNTSRFWLYPASLSTDEHPTNVNQWRSLPLYDLAVVEFRASCSSTCIRTSRIFPDLSITYSNKNLSFGIVDLGLFPNAAEKFGISLSMSMGQLPTYILFDNGVEVARLPEVDFEAKASRLPITKRLLCRHFELDRHLIEYIHIK